MEWKVVPNFSRYEVSENGELRRSDTRAIIKWHLAGGRNEKNRYQTYTLTSDEGPRKTLTVHRVVALAFLGTPHCPKLHAAHIDGNRNNNHYTNLKWATSLENNRDKIRHGTSKIIGVRSHSGALPGTRIGSHVGVLNPRAKLKEEDVITMRHQYSSGYFSYGSLAKIYGIDRRHMGKIISRKIWPHLP